MSKISPLAIIEDGAKIGENVEVGPYCFISKDATIGDNTSIAQNSCIYGKTTIGKGNKIYSHAVIGSDPQDLKYQKEDNVELVIGDNNTIREFTLLNPGTLKGGGVTSIGSNNLFMGYVHIGHDVIVGDSCIFANAATIAGHVEIGNYVVVGGMTPIHQFVKIGSHAMLAGASAVSQDVPPYCMVEGNRAVLKGLNLTGLRRRDFQRDEIDALKSAYKQLFDSGKPLKDVANELLESSTYEHVKRLCDFIINTKRGISYIRKSSLKGDKNE